MAKRLKEYTDREHLEGLVSYIKHYFRELPENDIINLGEKIQLYVGGGYYYTFYMDNIKITLGNGYMMLYFKGSNFRDLNIRKFVLQYKKRINVDLKEKLRQEKQDKIKRLEKELEILKS